MRLQVYDYSQEGAYFITICTYKQECLFGKIENEEMILNEAGKTASECWLKIPEHYPHVILHEHIVMPNHVHEIIQLTVPVEAQNFEPNSKTYSEQRVQNIEPLQRPEPLQRKNEFQKIIPGSIGSIVRGYKIGVTKWFRDNTDIYKPWQRNFHDHIIRDEESYIKITNYIINNPRNWKDDKFYK